MKRLGNRSVLDEVNYICSSDYQGPRPHFQKRSSPDSECHGAYFIIDLNGTSCDGPVCQAVEMDHNLSDRVFTLYLSFR